MSGAQLLMNTSHPEQKAKIFTPQVLISHGQPKSNSSISEFLAKSFNKSGGSGPDSMSAILLDAS